MGSAFVPNQVRDRLQPVYDTYTLAKNTATPSTITFFGNTAGAAGIQKTNMTEAFRMSNGISLKVLAVRLWPIAVSRPDLESLLKNYALRFIVGQKTFLEGPIEFFPGGAGITGVTTATTTAATTTIQDFSYSIGPADPRAIFGLGQFPLDVPFGTSFRVELVGATFTTSNSAPYDLGLHLKCALDSVWTEIPQ